MNKPSVELYPEIVKQPRARLSLFGNRHSRTLAANRLAGFFYLLCILALCFVLGMILIMIGRTGLLTFGDISLRAFLSLNWTPEDDQFGAGSLILGTLMLTGLTMLFAVPLSIGIAIFLSVIAPPWVKRLLRPLMDMLVGIPSVVYGYIGLTVIVPIIQRASGENLGDGLLAAALVLTLMILPTVSRISDDAITAVPERYREASYALGSTRLQLITRILLPSASRGIITAVILGMARAIGETMAVVMVIGNTAQLAKSLVMPTAVLTSNIVMQISNVEFNSTWNHALYLMAFLLLLISLLLIIIIRFIRPKKEESA
ncbi:phosphate ABC transporter permease subunit PstC [Gorillibacterium massiliense]|uniref:phosphate ABC transporter permease subunit PstC n=1 Tax=Gorillibacterium massiliense TaxID=1280390 RepID=UPI0004B4C9A1|nr:phosphate ABC transporter permease subunit PstC [Gorillibacterium massiliense]